LIWVSDVQDADAEIDEHLFRYCAKTAIARRKFASLPDHVWRNDVGEIPFVRDARLGVRRPKRKKYRNAEEVVLR
jgi:hypothetical protein